LGEPGRLILLPPVRRELGQWLADPRDTNAHLADLVRLAANGEATSPIRYINSRDFKEDMITIEYYVNLIGVRKRAWSIAADDLGETLGRKPDNQEVSNYIETAFGPRTQRLARDGASAKIAAHIYNDEECIILAIIEAVRTGRRIAILTKDEGLYDQFYKA